MRGKRLVGVPFLFAVASSAVGFSIYFSIGVVADRGLGLTPVIFLAAGLLFALTTLTYVEGGAMFRERGGSSTFARHAFNELISFIAGWAILIDYVIVIAAAAITVPHYLEPISGSLTNGAEELGVAAGVILLAALLNALGVTGGTRQARLLVIAFADVALQAAVIVVGAIVVTNPELLTAELNLFTTPSAEDIVYAAVVATIAYAGIEAASDLAPDLDFEPKDLKRVLSAGSVLVPLMYAGIAAVALMAVPVEQTPDGPRTALAESEIDAPVLGVVQAFDPAWVADVMQWAVVLIAVPVLIWAANTSMLGVSRHVYVLATNRQIPSWAGRLERTHATPYVAIGIAAVMALALAIPADIEFLAGVYAFGALLAATIAHLSVIRLRFTDPVRERPFRVPGNIRVGGHQVPLPAVVAAIASGLLWVSVIAFHGGALKVGGGWMAFGLALLRLLPQGGRGDVADAAGDGARAVAEEAADRRRGVLARSSSRCSGRSSTTTSSLPPAAWPTPEDEEGMEHPPRLDVIYVAAVPLTVPIDAPLPEAERKKADARARPGGPRSETSTRTSSWERPSCGRGRWARGSWPRLASGGPR